MDSMALGIIIGGAIVAISFGSVNSWIQGRSCRIYNPITKLFLSTTYKQIAWTKHEVDAEVMTYSEATAVCNAVERLTDFKLKIDTR